jgi:hypothetical protein
MTPTAAQAEEAYKDSEIGRELGGCGQGCAGALITSMGLWALIVLVGLKLVGSVTYYKENQRYVTPTHCTITAAAPVVPTKK